MTKKKKVMSAPRPVERQREMGIDGSKLRAAREKAGMTQLDLAVALRERGLGTTSAAISQIELGKYDTSAGLLRHLRTVLRCTADSLLLD